MSAPTGDTYSYRSVTTFERVTWTRGDGGVWTCDDGRDETATDEDIEQARSGGASMSVDPILVECEGSGCPTHHPAICSMCGETVDLEGEVGARGHERPFVAAPHTRKDILAMLDRGDFDGGAS